MEEIKDSLRGVRSGMRSSRLSYQIWNGRLGGVRQRDSLLQPPMAGILTAASYSTNLAVEKHVHRS